ncbi:Hint domain-containing protein [Paracoccus sp. (in: a-proteobacteria)]|uniref:Hint domain-containing protein n=1 Tax=Paracoccus sp. TaxID=267 RepID=UPI003A8BB93A
MSLISITLYATTIADGIVQADSTQITIDLDDLNGDGIISRDDWANYTADPNGHIAGFTDPPALFNGDETGNVLFGTLYSPVEYSTGDDITDLLKTLTKSKYYPQIDGLNICYLAGTMIATPQGDVPVETLKTGDLVMTVDNGPQPVVWASSSFVTRGDLDVAPNQRPIRIEAGALGNDLPRNAVEVSPQHRVVVADADGDEFMISARHLMMAGTPGVHLCPEKKDFTLVHVACANHEVLLAEGAPMESFYTGKMAIKALGIPQRLALIAAFPEIGSGENPMQPARPFIKHRDYSAMLQTA